MINMSKTYKVRINDGSAYRMFYISPKYVETYVLLGYDILVEEIVAIEVTPDFLEQLEVDASNGVFIEYWASKDDVSFVIPIIKIPEFSNRGYTIFKKHDVLLDDPWAEIQAINVSCAVE